MVVKAARAPAVKPIGSKAGSAPRTAATPAVAVGRTVARMPPGPVVESEGRGAGGARECDRGQGEYVLGLHVPGVSRERHSSLHSAAVQIR